jgi:hypothetical protein
VCDDRRDEVLAVTLNLDMRRGRRDAACGVDRRAFVSARGQPGGLTRGINAANLHRHRGDTGQAQHQRHDQRGDRERGLDGARTGTAG